MFFTIPISKNKELAKANSFPMRREGLEPSRPKAVTGSLVLRVCQFRHPRVDYFTSISTLKFFVKTFFRFFQFFIVLIQKFHSVFHLPT